MKYVINEYDICSPKIKSNRDIICVSDIHSDVIKLKKIRDILKKLKISTLLISGDLIDTMDDSRNHEIYEIMKSIALFSSIFITKGNHDMINYGHKRTPVIADDIFFNKLSLIDGITVFNEDIDKISLFDDIDLYSLTMPITWYFGKEKEEEFENKIIDNIDVDIDKFNIMLSHSPNGFLKDGVIKDYLSYLNYMNLILCGHMHGGLLPLALRKENKHGGLFGPYASFFPENSYGIYYKNYSYLILSGGVTKISNVSELRKFSSFFDSFFASEVELLHLKSKVAPQTKFLKRNYIDS